MLRRWIPIALLLQACPNKTTTKPSAQGSQTTKPAKTPGRVAPSEAERPKPISPSPKPPARPMMGAPFTLDRSGFTPPNVPVALTFFGWSQDGQRYAFETFEPSEGADCGDRYSLYVVDATKDAFVQNGTLIKSHLSPEPGPGGCQPKNLKGDFAKARDARLATLGIIKGNLLPPRRFERAQKRWKLPRSQGAALLASFEVLHQVQDPYDAALEKGAAYKLSLHPAGAAAIVVEPGERRRKGVMRYALDHGLIFESPNRKCAALLIQRLNRGFEGGTWGWMSNGIKWP